MTNDAIRFPDRESFREWLDVNHDESGGIWLLFGKKGGPVTLTAAEALEEALCFGWIDGQMRSLDAAEYRKYFARRTPKSKWSEKNKKLAQELIDRGMMTHHGLAAIERAKEGGAWDAARCERVGDEQIEAFRELIRQYELAHANLSVMPRSIQRTYTGFYLEAKSEKTRQNRLEKIVDRLNRNLKPM